MAHNVGQLKHEVGTSDKVANALNDDLQGIVVKRTGDQVVLHDHFGESREGQLITRMAEMIREAVKEQLYQS